MKLKGHGKSISDIEVLNISLHGFWLYVKGKEYFLSYQEYPWFRDVRVSEILNVNLLHQSHLYWPQLDIDLELISLENLEQYPLVYH